MKFTIRDAIQNDSDKLIELTALTPMKGIIGLRIDRKPDFFKLLRLGDSYLALVATTIENDIVGFFAAVRTRLCLSGKETIAWYVRDLKVHPAYKGSSVGFRLVKTMQARLNEVNADILCCTVAAGNDLVVPFFEGRTGIPEFIKLSDFHVYQLLPARVKKNEIKNLSVVNNSLTGFFEKFFKRYSYYPMAYTEEPPEGSIMLTECEGETVNAAIVAFDGQAYRQNVVTSYSWMIAALLAALKFLKLFLPLAPLPGKNEPLKMVYARWYAFAKGKEKAFTVLLKRLRHYAFDNGYHFVCIAVNAADHEVVRMVKPMSSFVFKSSVMIASLKNDHSLLNDMRNGLSYEDYAIV
ncbi:MAG TPA: GNAT family N-acetyltransferase [Parafilimonas sp.]|nr:GNAT family N-acetyltransferase [Parafilimonas sp.]